MDSSLRTAEMLANEISSGTYKPCALDACDAFLTGDRNPLTIRMVEFTLFAEPHADHWSSPRYLILQPQLLQDGTTAASDEADFRRNVVQPTVKRWETQLPTKVLPSPTAPLRAIREAVQPFTPGPLAQRTLGNEAGASPTSNGNLRKAYANWLQQENGKHLRRLVQPYMGAFGLSMPVSKPISLDALNDLLSELFFPKPYQPIDSGFPLVGLCATYEQIWEPRGYTRGEMVGAVSLAPGEKLTLEVHNWDKSTARSEEELSVEFEMRSSEKLTQRDALSVVQELSKQRNSSVNASGTVPIPKMPITLGKKVSTETRQSLTKTKESLREQSVEAANTLKQNRKTRIEISRDVGREKKQTRHIENTNRCHALNCCYFEVVANYLVTTRLVAIQPCVLLPNPRPAFTLGWILCHEGALIESLLDRTMLAGFEAAKVLRAHSFLEELEIKTRLADLDRREEQTAPYVHTLADCYRAIVAARDHATATIETCGNDIFCQLESLSALSRERLMTWFALPLVVRSALDRLLADIAAGKNVSDVLKRFLSVTGPQLLSVSPTEATLRKQWLEFFGHTWLFPGKDPLSCDDAGLRAAVEVAAQYVRASANDAPTAQASYKIELLAESRVELERLQCHLEEHWLHYCHAVWAREDDGQRFVRLQSSGPVSLVIENELLGFYGDRSAYPLRDTSAVTALNLSAFVDEVKADLVNGNEEPVLITVPTANTVLETFIGKCDACEDYIDDSRALDLRTQEAKARQEEAEASRREMRLAATPPDLDSPVEAPNELRVMLNTSPKAEG